MLYNMAIGCELVVELKLRRGDPIMGEEKTYVVIFHYSVCHHFELFKKP